MRCRMRRPTGDGTGHGAADRVRLEAIVRDRNSPQEARLAMHPRSHAVEREVPADKAVHAVLDNYVTHNHPEGLFAKLARQRLKRGVFHLDYRACTLDQFCIAHPSHALLERLPSTDGCNRPISSRAGWRRGWRRRIWSYEGPGPFVVFGDEPIDCSLTSSLEMWRILATGKAPRLRHR